jgi:hypothetical protein
VIFSVWWRGPCPRPPCPDAQGRCGEAAARMMPILLESCAVEPGSVGASHAKACHVEPECSHPSSCRAERSGVETSGRESDVAPFRDRPFGRKDSWVRPMALGVNARHGLFAARSLHCGPLRGPPVEMTRRGMAASGRDDKKGSAAPPVEMTGKGLLGLRSK